MLQVTQSAASALAEARSRQGLPDHFGVRIFASARATPDMTASYRFGFVEAPQTDDQVTEAEGTQVFVAPEVAPLLDHSVLDTQQDGDGLVLLPQQEPQ